jgi:ribonuclease HI
VDTVTITIDGSALGNPGPGGWAALVRTEGRETMLAGASPEPTTNNRMELTALREGLRALKAPSVVTVVTDSEYVRGTLALGWKRRANHDLLAEIDALLRVHTVTFEVVRGHGGHLDNERVDKVARAEAEKARGALAVARRVADEYAEFSARTDALATAAAL